MTATGGGYDRPMPPGQTSNQMQTIERVKRIRTPWFRPAPGAPVDELIEAIRAGDRWSEGSRFVKRDGDRWVWMGALSAASGVHALVIKGRSRRFTDVLPDRHAIKQSIGAQRLHAAGVPTSLPLAILDVLSGNGDRERWLVLAALQGESLAHHCKRGDVSPALAQRAGELVRTITGAGLFNRDHKASNLIVTPEGGVGVIDTVAIRKAAGSEPQRRMLLAMCMELQGINAMPRRSQLLRCLLAASDDWRTDWRAIDAMLRAAGDTTPRINPVSGE